MGKNGPKMNRESSALLTYFSNLFWTIAVLVLASLKEPEEQQLRGKGVGEGD